MISSVLHLCPHSLHLRLRRMLPSRGLLSITLLAPPHTSQRVDCSFGYARLNRLIDPPPGRLTTALLLRLANNDFLRRHFVSTVVGIPRSCRSDFLNDAASKRSYRYLYIRSHAIRMAPPPARTRTLVADPSASGHAPSSDAVCLRSRSAAAMCRPTPGTPLCLR